MESAGPDGETDSFSRSNDPRAVHGFFGDPEFRRDFYQKNSWTSISTLSMEPIGFDGQTDPFSKSNEPRAGKPPSLSIFVCYSLWIFL
ncbi:hypothetical protein H5410_012944 [Solanum commersonii]|uniref:Uncharacterized protein n=1 Tax=Solanum commersonii TaxID=4109 RepID=A0A9J6AT35_SOLCO|nr:hypothetical protein H5410_012944 [Solanum commersonii]